MSMEPVTGANYRHKRILVDLEPNESENDPGIRAKKRRLKILPFYVQYPYNNNEKYYFNRKSAKKFLKRQGVQDKEILKDDEKIYKKIMEKFDEHIAKHHPEPNQRPNQNINVKHNPRSQVLNWILNKGHDFERA